MPLVRPIIPLLALVVILSSGCATNPVAQFYRNLIPPEAAKNVGKYVQPYSGHTQIFGSENLRKDNERMLQRGYLLLGASAFRGAVTVSDDNLLAQAKAVGADVVLFSSEYQGTRQTAVPFMQFNPGQSYTTRTTGQASATAYGRAGTVTATADYQGTSTTTTPGAFSTSIMPVTVRDYEYEASFWRKAHPRVLGVKTDAIPDNLRVELQRNAGAYVSIVVDDSPAFRANILVGDIIVGIDGEGIYSPAQLTAMLPTIAGRKVTLKVLRNGQPIEVEVQLNPEPK